MPSSGITVSDNAVNTFKRVFGVGDKNKLPYALFKYDDALKELIVDCDMKFYSKQFDYHGLLEMLPTDSPRIVAFDFSHLNKDGTKKSTVILLSWTPEDCPSKLRFVNGSTFLNVRQVFGVTSYVEGSEMSDINEQEILGKFSWSAVPEDKQDPLSQVPLKIQLDA